MADSSAREVDCASTEEQRRETDRSAEEGGRHIG